MCRLTAALRHTAAAARRNRRAGRADRNGHASGHQLKQLLDGRWGRVPMLFSGSSGDGGFWWQWDCGLEHPRRAPLRRHCEVSAGRTRLRPARPTFRAQAWVSKLLPPLR